MLWYPGHPPFCSDVVLRTLNKVTDCLATMLAEQSGAKLGEVKYHCLEAAQALMQEGEDCLYTDDTVNELLTFFELLPQAVESALIRRDWEDLAEGCLQAKHIETLLAKAVRDLTDGTKNVSDEEFRQRYQDSGSQGPSN